MNKPQKLLPAIYGGTIMGIIAAVPFLNLMNCLCCAGIILGGFLAVFFYKSNFTPDTPTFSAGDCLAVGALAGVAGAIIGTLLTAASMSIFGNVMVDFISELIRSMDLPEEVIDQVEEALAQSLGGGMILIEFLTNLILYPLFGLLGGLIGYGIFKPKQQVMPTGQIGYGN